MFDFIRQHQRLMQLVLLVLILPSFALIGVSGYSNYVSGDHELVKVGDSAVTSQEFDQARRNQLQQLQNRVGASFDPAMLDNVPARKALLDSLVDRRVVVATAMKEHFSVSDAVLRQTIASIPELQVDGRFSPERYSQVLASMGVSSHDFEQGQRSDLALQRVLGPVSMTASVPAPVVQSLEQALTAQRTVRLRVFAADDFKKGIQVSDADIKAWYEKNPQRFEVPEYVEADYLLLDEAAAMRGVPEVSSEDMHKYYEQNKSRYVTPGRVQLSHIQVSLAPDASAEQRDKAQARAEEIAKKVAADKSKFAEIASAESDDAGTAKDGGKLGWISKGVWPADLENAVFALKKGDVSGVLEGPGGLHIFMADDVQPEQGETFEQAKSKVQSEIRRQLGADRFADMASKLTSLVYDNAGSLKPAADALGLAVKQANGIAHDRLLPAAEVDGGTAASASPDATVLEDMRVRRALFSPQVFTDKNNSGVIEISPSTMVVVRVAKVTPKHVQPLDKASASIREQLVNERAASAAEKAGEALLASLNSGASASLDGFGSALTVSRVNAQGLNKEVLDTAFGVQTAKLPAYAGLKGPGGYVVVQVEHAAAGKPDASMKASLSTQLAQAWGQAEEQAVLKAMKAAIGVKMLPEAEKALAGENKEQG
ncbi:SurA N-terminal domain-containing protein [Eoetvoesiella caeni]|uniref:Periplasmic chaperone PpiD n=1 Tax=Eoetvoesiella caeni TaxID=645616 RepID=A0A366HKW7_9BURK|nr:SurA N-terminal domain-containing protein [Eoetvoesiella caeni]MCI2807506.1 SurA N-terminal domain-containing protein [Eoetvoesiella caeni]NYT53099.1 SurA N-terminal domain-containing protein [Eoetvoesiella caeni]RBP43076.1 peptidyl-prolyl cis-trans isomerase D [Eoetvoesiella caeni]